MFMSTNMNKLCINSILKIKDDLMNLNIHRFEDSPLRHTNLDDQSSLKDFVFLVEESTHK
jgi:hypothetical protein